MLGHELLGTTRVPVPDRLPYSAMLPERDAAVNVDRIQPEDVKMTVGLGVCLAHNRVS